jgi:hypothetical protein
MNLLFKKISLIKLKFYIVIKRFKVVGKNLNSQLKKKKQYLIKIYNKERIKNKK